MTVRLVIPLVFARIEVDIGHLLPMQWRSRRGRSVLRAGHALNGGSRLRSPSGHWALVMQEDGNVVLGHGRDGPKAASGTDGHPGARLEMQADGNLVIYGPDHVALKSTGTDGNPGAVLKVQDDGNTVIYGPGHVPLRDRWSGHFWRE